MALSSAKEIIDDIRQGKMVILMDDEDRENEGDLIIASEKITPEAINFMATYGRGLICLTLSKARCQKLNLPLMVQENTEQFGTPFTVSIEAAEGVTTGISAADRSRTVQAAVAANATAADIVMPGHIFPLMAQEGGVLTRAGHTEAGCDVARLAGLEPSSVIVEILNEDGTMARRPQLEVFAEKHGLKLGTIADLIEYRNNHETTIERVAECRLPTEFGEFDMITYRDKIDNEVHYALRKGDIKAGEETLVRVHLQDTFKDILQSGATQWTLPAAMKRISEENGVLVILSKQESTDAIIHKVRNIAAEEAGQPKVKVTQKDPSRQVGVGSQILSDLGVSKMRLLSSSTQRYHSLSGFGLEVVEYICD
ncbi:bifunctional 3,4-dihydroxy-2-butanone-4-phosphate synthase/GTP cyclohydrolase II [Photobacterium angustum]|uniref:3,4-dihydroxy-2-butanone 4-phosphate synthase n=1 Tax=Photobacterium angustum TaxID=661 RepID=A0A855SLE7_PHOAN|nr:bifunctional 3,4-dihydroxy-2-butanone-4-phosphate synthase/GTP cyclohydrolase II [Photobacterium angustum]KJF82953.1 3,4-dihydroxy-2-butanone 4-phosphate synthase [Photobacterium damselae subsp. damselae]KJG03815.1 3,4-dihydroxy-2-butanone 4-phosphate synthase [Photobacterium angustum]KJG18488.1 3,4-dihydroxy-2-butanone 4-phosphate synthase [Photobacterium angustum]KJG25950.1 3,4-dihydroxy-2-butanone 4-phosphate synthase [Photobacterium angustum]KJG34133.1 3,4-dihydroxy-2-butanone 4-phospha